MVTVDLGNLFPGWENVTGHVRSDTKKLNVVLENPKQTCVIVMDSDYLYDSLHKIRTAKNA